MVSLMTGALTTALTSITETSGVQIYGSKVKITGRITVSVVVARGKASFFFHF